MRLLPRCVLALTVMLVVRVMPQGFLHTRRLVQTRTLSSKVSPPVDNKSRAGHHMEPEDRPLPRASGGGTGQAAHIASGRASHWPPTNYS